MTTEKETTRNIHSMLTKHEIDFRSKTLKKIIELNRPVFPNELNVNEDDSNYSIDEILSSLTDKNLMVLQEDGAICGAYPVSALPTPHKVYTSGQHFFYAMCAIDALGTSFELDEKLSISSSCKQCNKEISIEIQNGKLGKINPPTTHALHVDLQKYKDWAGSCWNNMNFFCTKEHLDEWIEQSSLNKNDIYGIDIELAVSFAKAVFGK